MSEPTKQWRAVYIWEDAYFDKVHDTEKAARDEIKKITSRYVLHPCRARLEVREVGPWKEVEL